MVKSPIYADIWHDLVRYVWLQILFEGFDDSISLL